MAAIAEVTTTNSRPEFAPALQTIVELVRRIMNADVSSILAFSLIDKTVRWKAASGFTVEVDYSQPVFRPLGSAIARRAFTASGPAARPAHLIHDGISATVYATVSASV